MYVGRFVHDGTWATPEFHPQTGIVFPKVRLRLTASDFRPLGPEFSTQLAELLTPDGYICVELTETNDRELNAVRQLVEAFACDVLGRGLYVSTLEAQIGNRAEPRVAP
jgi:hypothetical protein